MGWRAKSWKQAEAVGKKSAAFRCLLFMARAFFFRCFWLMLYLERAARPVDRFLSHPSIDNGVWDFGVSVRIFVYMGRITFIINNGFGPVCRALCIIPRNQ